MTRELEAAISADYLREVVERLATFRAHPLGFRVPGTPEERAATEYIADEMRAAGLEDVIEEPVPADAWHFEDAFVEANGRRYECASMGGVPETGRAGVSGELVSVGRGDRRELDRHDVGEKVLLVDWRDEDLWPYDVAVEAGLRGAVGLVLTSTEGGPYFQAPNAIGTFDSMWHAGAPPMVTLRKEDAEDLMSHEGERVRVVLVAPLTRGAEAANVVGILPGRERTGPLLVGGHHDGWLGDAAFDDATGVAATLALARAFTETGVRPRHAIAFISHTAEEYGIVESRYDWCYGAWYQIVAEHREWAARAPFYLNIEGSGHGGRLGVDPPPELRAWARRLCRRAEKDGLLPHGWLLRTPTTWTEVWTFLAAGVPGINCSTFDPDYKRTEYHTQYDTVESVDYDYLALLTRLYARFLLEADADPDGILDYGERARELRKTAPELADVAGRLERAEGRAAFTRVGRALHGLDSGDAAAYPHEGARENVRQLETGLEAVRAGDRRRAVRALERVGLNALTRDVGAKAFAQERARRSRNAPRPTWAAQGDPCDGPDLWHELASLRGESGSREPGPWLERRLERELSRARRELARRLDRMRKAVDGRAPALPRP